MCEETASSQSDGFHPLAVHSSHTSFLLILFHSPLGPQLTSFKRLAQWMKKNKRKGTAFPQLFFFHSPDYWMSLLANRKIKKRCSLSYSWDAQDNVISVTVLSLEMRVNKFLLAYARLRLGPDMS